MAYGLTGLLFLMFIASQSQETSTANYRYYSPTAWYWQWIPSTPGTGQNSVSENSEEIDDVFEDDDFDGESDWGTDLSGGTREQSAGGWEYLTVGSADYPWGIDSGNRDILVYMGQGAVSYLLYGAMAIIIALVSSILWATVIEWPIRQELPVPHKPRLWQRALSSTANTILESLDNIPKILLLLVLYSLSGVTMTQFGISMGVFLTFGAAISFRNQFATLLSSEQYLYAVEIGLKPSRIFWSHIFKRRLLPAILVQIPTMLSAFILYESTLTWLSFTSADMSSWGTLISSNPGVGANPLLAVVDSVTRARNYGFIIPIVSLLFIVSSLFILGDALREKLTAENA